MSNSDLRNSKVVPDLVATSWSIRALIVFSSSSLSGSGSVVSAVTHAAFLDAAATFSLDAISLSLLTLLLLAPPLQGTPKPFPLVVKSRVEGLLEPGPG